jgi:glycosyltransferase involved in cell wall biosynthesis
MSEGGARVRYLGPLDHGDDRLVSAMAACAAFVLPSTLETPGLAALEAAAAGARVVITSEGSTRDYFGPHVDYVDHRDASDIRRGIDRALGGDTGQGLKAHVTARFAWPAVTQRLVEVYEAARRRRAGR